MCLYFRPRIIAADGKRPSCWVLWARTRRAQEGNMHPEYVEKAPRGAGWYIYYLLEDGTMLEAGLTQARRRARPQVHRAGRREARRHRSFLRRRGELCGAPSTGTARVSSPATRPRSSEP